MSKSSFAPVIKVTQDDEEDVQEKIQVCIFELSDRLFGLSIFEVQEIMEDAVITPVPATPHFLRGVINLRGNIVPVVDIREVLHLPIKAPTRDSRIMILDIKKARVGIFVDAISEVTHIAKRIIQPETRDIGVSDGKFIANVIQYKEGFLILLNLAYLHQAIQL